MKAKVGEMKRLLKRGRGEGSSSSPPTAPVRSPRQLWWVGLFLSSLVAMGSTFEAVRMQRYYDPIPNATQRWAVGSVTAVFLSTFVLIALQMVPHTSRILSGTKLELVLIVIVAAFACAAVGTATNPATGMAVNASGGVSFGNLYYSTWASFGCTLALLLSFVRTERGLDVSHELKARGRRFRFWVVLIVTSIIVMGSSASAYDAKCGDVTEELEYKPRKYCRRAAFGVSAGCVGCIGSLAVVAMRLTCSKQVNLDDGSRGRSNKVIFAIECTTSLVLLCLYCFAVAYLTSEEGPGAPLGNLYYSTWITFGLVGLAAASCLGEVQAAKAEYKVRNRGQGGSVGMSHGDLSSINMSNHSRMGPSDADWPEDNNVNDFAPAMDPRGGTLNNSFRSQSQAGTATSIGSMRSGSVGEVQVDLPE